MLDDLEKTAIVPQFSDSEDFKSISNKSNLVYHLQFNPHQVKLDYVSKEGELVQRLDKLEHFFGAVPDKMVDLFKFPFSIM